MKVVLNTISPLYASQLKNRIINSINGSIRDVIIDTWSYIKAGDGFDVIFHNPDQYVLDPQKNVIFRIVLDGSNVVISTAWWSRNPKPDHDMFFYHVGRLTEMLLKNFSEDIQQFSIFEF